MIRFSLIFAFIGLLMSCNSTSETIVSVHVEGAKPESKVLIITKDSTYSGSLDSLGVVKFTLAKDLKSGYARINYRRISIPVYVEPGKGFDVAVKMEGRQVSTVFTGEGAGKNDYLNNKTLSDFRPDFQLTEDAFIAALAEKENQLSGLLDSLAFDRNFSNQEKKRIHYLIYNALPLYPDYHSYYAKDTAYKASDRYYDVMTAAVVEEEKPMDMPEYLETLKAAVGTFAERGMEKYDALVFLKNRLAYVQQNFKNPELVEYLVDQFVTSYVGNMGVDDLADFAPIYNEKVTSPEKKAAFDALCTKWSKIAKGQPSADFKYLDINGKEVGLADLAGKYVYIDVWATWCGPCRGELPYLQKLEHQFKDKNIHFVSISCDQDKAAWEKMVKGDKLGGIQLHVGQDRAFMDSYMIRGIPRFILLDKEGKILKANMTRPSNQQTVEILNALEGI